MMSNISNIISILGTVISIIATVGALFWTVKKYKADLISKTRIEWLKEIREKYGNYVGSIISIFNGQSENKYSYLADIKHYQLELLTYFGVDYNENIYYSVNDEKIIGVDGNIEASCLNIVSMLKAITDEVTFFAGKIDKLPQYDKDKKVNQKIENGSSEIIEIIEKNNKPSATFEYDNGDIEKATLVGSLLDNEYRIELENNLNVFNKVITKYLNDQWQLAREGK